jgi:hypothetical protein
MTKSTAKKTITKRIPRLDATALRTITKTMKANKQFRSMVQNSPFYKDLIQTVEKNVKLADSGRLSQSNVELKFIFSRFIHLNLIHSLLVLISHEPDCLVVLRFPRRHMKVEIFTDRDDGNRLFYLVDVYKNDEILRQLSFWNKDEFVSYLIDLLMTLPKEVSVFRSSISMTASPVHSFIQLVGETFGETRVPQKIVRLYNQRKQV